MQKEESNERDERDARQSRKGSGSDLGRVANESDLAVRTKSFALQIIRLFSALPKTTEAQVVGKQVLRSGTSVGANYREAYRARSKPEFIAKCGDSLRELEETAYWLELLIDGKIVASEKLRNLRQECGELIAIFVTILKRSKEAPS
jgi:four helix bundle protein